MINTHKKLILEFQLEDGSDFEALTTVYRMIFRFLLEFTPNSIQGFFYIYFFNT